MKYAFIENEKINGIGEVEQLDENVINLEISDDLYNEIHEDSLKYCYSDGQIIVNPDYETLKQQELNRKRIEQIEEELKDLDEKRIRAVCENSVKDPQTGETWLDFYNSKVLELRDELNTLKNSL